jgi:DNA-directed RNA polymerase subunit beta'
LIAVSRSGLLIIHDKHGAEREQYKLPYGAVITIRDNDKVKASQVVANWDPHTHPIITEVAGRLQFVDLMEGVTMTRQTDEMTGLSSIVVSSASQRGAIHREMRPMVKLVNAKGADVMLPGSNVPAHYFLPEGTIINKENEESYSPHRLFHRNFQPPHFGNFG